MWPNKSMIMVWSRIL